MLFLCPEHGVKRLFCYANLPLSAGLKMLVRAVDRQILITAFRVKAKTCIPAPPILSFAALCCIIKLYGSSALSKPAAMPQYNALKTGGVIMTEVVAALIWSENKFMICRRPADKARGLLWEFVGGKVEPNETKEQALIRECREELDIILNVGEEFMAVIHEYPDITVRLTLFNASIKEGVPKLLEHSDLKWITPDEIPQYEFCPADEEILKRITEACTPDDKRDPDIP